jgi:hypothetical protein
MCPGGRRIPVTIDIAKAGEVLSNRWTVTEEQSPLGVTSKHVGHWLHDIVAAALVDPDGKPLT